MPFSSCPLACREPSGHGVSAALPLHVHYPAVEPVLHAPDHPLPPPPRAGLAEGVCAVRVLRWLGPGHWTGESRGPGAPPQLISVSVHVCQGHRERVHEPGAHLGLEQQSARSVSTSVFWSGVAVCVSCGGLSITVQRGGSSGWVHLVWAPYPPHGLFPQQECTHELSNLGQVPYLLTLLLNLRAARIL